MADKCEMCGEKPFSRNDQFCKRCRKALLDEMKAAGFLTPRLPYSGVRRTADQKELVHETKRGTSHG